MFYHQWSRSDIEFRVRVRHTNLKVAEKKTKDTEQNSTQYNALVPSWPRHHVMQYWYILLSYDVQTPTVTQPLLPGNT